MMDWSVLEFSSPTATLAWFAPHICALVVRSTITLQDGRQFSGLSEVQPGNNGTQQAAGLAVTTAYLRGLFGQSSCVKPRDDMILRRR